MEGYLAKKGRGQSVSFIRPWATRYFVLDEEMNELRYYEKDNKLKCKGNLHLTGVQVFERKDTDKEFCFEIRVLEDNGVLILSAQDEATKASWTKAFTNISKSEIRSSILAPGEQTVSKYSRCNIATSHHQTLCVYVYVCIICVKRPIRSRHTKTSSAALSERPPPPRP